MRSTIAHDVPVPGHLNLTLAESTTPKMAIASQTQAMNLIHASVSRRMDVSPFDADEFESLSIANGVYPHKPHPPVTSSCG